MYFSQNPTSREVEDGLECRTSDFFNRYHDNRTTGQWCPLIASANKSKDSSIASSSCTAFWSLVVVSRFGQLSTETYLEKCEKIKMT